MSEIRQRSVDRREFVKGVTTAAVLGLGGVGLGAGEANAQRPVTPQEEFPPGVPQIVPRAYVGSNGAFHSAGLPFEEAGIGIRNALKLEFETTDSIPTFATDRMLIDFGAVLPQSIDLSRVDRDCDLLKQILRNHPDVVQQLIAAVTSADADRILSIATVLRQIGFTEQFARQQGGGFIFLLIVVGAALLAAGCTGVTAHGRTGKQPPKTPGNPPPPPPPPATK